MDERTSQRGGLAAIRFDMDEGTSPFPLRLRSRQRGHHALVINGAIASFARIVAGAPALWHEQLDPSATYFFYANHASNLDAPIIWAHMPPRLRARTRPVAARDYWVTSATRRYLSSSVFDCLLVDRVGGPEARAGAEATVARMVEALGSHHNLIIFPEGTRAQDGRIAAFKSGLYHAIRQAPHVQLVPTYLENLGRILPKGSSIPVPMTSRTIFGAPWTIDEDESKDDFLRRARDRLLELQALAGG